MHVQFQIISIFSLFLSHSCYVSLDISLSLSQDLYKKNEFDQWAERVTKRLLGYQEQANQFNATSVQGNTPTHTQTHYSCVWFLTQSVCVCVMQSLVSSCVSLRRWSARCHGWCLVTMGNSRRRSCWRRWKSSGPGWRRPRTPPITARSISLSHSLALALSLCVFTALLVLLLTTPYSIIPFVSICLHLQIFISQIVFFACACPCVHRECMPVSWKCGWYIQHVKRSWMLWGGERRTDRASTAVPSTGFMKNYRCVVHSR